MYLGIGGGIKVEIHLAGGVDPSLSILELCTNNGLCFKHASVLPV